MWQSRLQDNYENLGEWISYANMYGLAKRLGYEDPIEAWKENPFVQGSTDPKDFKVVATGEVKSTFMDKIYVTDPDSKSLVELEVRKLSGGPMVGIDASYLEQDVGLVFSPYDAMTVVAISDNEMDICRCDNCGWEGTFTDNDLLEINDLAQRIEAGGVVPARQCPECQCLAYKLKE